MNSPKPHSLHPRFRKSKRSLVPKNIVSFHISGGLSSTVQAYKRAADNLAKNNIHVVTQILTYGLAFQVHEALRLARRFEGKRYPLRVSRLATD